MTTWSPAQLKELKEAYSKKPAWTTDMQLARSLSGQFRRSVESVRWQLRQLRSDESVVEAPKILILDIETLPIEALVWGVYKQNIYMDQIKKDWSVLCWSAKWLFDSEVMGEVVTPKEAMAHDDKSVLEGAWNLVNEADMVITHNGDEFDLKKLNARFFIHGFPPPMYTKSVDTKKVAKDNFSFTYNKLDWISQIVGIGRKIETEFNWWKECEAGNKEYLDMMLEYNMQDVHLEEEVYLKLRPWVKGHPNMALFNIPSNVPACPACGGLDIHWGGKYATGLGLYKGFRCQSCGAIGRSTKKQYKLSASVAQN